MNELLIFWVVGGFLAAWFIGAGCIIGIFYAELKYKKKYSKYVSRENMNFIIENIEKRINK